MAQPPLPRDQFPVTERRVYVNHAGIGPLPVVATRAIADSAAAFRDDPDFALDHYEEVMERTRVAAADLMGTTVANVAFVNNTTDGLGLCASGIDWQPGDRVVVPNYEFPSNFYPWIALRDRGVVVDVIEPVGARRELPLELFEQSLRAAPTKVVAVSWVQFGFGWRVDLAGLGALCRDHDALLCVDAIQGLGVVPAQFDEWEVDVSSADAHKWLLGPHGIGVASFSSRARELIRPLAPGWGSVPWRDDYDNLDYEPDPSARRYEGGTTNLTTIAGLAASIELLQSAGVHEVWAHVDRLCCRLAAALAELGADVRSVHDRDNRSGIVSFVSPNRSADDVVAELQRRDVVARVRAGAVRLSPHAYNTDDEIDRVLAEIASLG
jgi:selenocysteine lyase/cysteine desulfurase